MRRFVGFIVSILFVASLIACGGPGPVSPQPSEDLTIEITPGSLLLTASAQTRILTARVLDGQGNILETPVTWSSSNPQAVTITADGTVTANTDVGSAQVSATVGEVSAIVLIVIAQPVDGAVLISDAQVVSDPEPLNADTSPELGSQYRVVLKDITPPVPGTIILASESKGIAGKVVSTGSTGEVVFETLPLNALFQTLSLNESLDLSKVEPVVFNEEGQPQITMSKLSSDSWQLVQPPSELEPLGENKFKLGIFTCTADTDIPNLSIPTFKPVLEI
jgi:hypothetical protein